MPHSRVEKSVSVGVSVLPAYLVEKQHKVKEYRETTFAPLEHNMEVAVKRTKGFTAHLRECTDLVEGSVLALGIPTAYQLASRLEEVRQGMDTIFSSWKALMVSRREENRLHDELYEASCGSYSTMKEKNDQLERELRTINMDRDRKDMALDNAIQYVHAVISERCAWQEQFGYNRQELPTEEITFSDHCTAALSSLYEARRVQSDTIVEFKKEKEQKIPSDRPYISLSDDAHTLSKRWSRIQDTQRSAVIKSCRLKYIPPEEEVKLLRDVLAMGTGSRVLMKDVMDERQRLEDEKAKVRVVCAKLFHAMKVVKHDLLLMKWFLRDTIDKRAPFAISIAEVTKLLTEHVESQAMSLSKQWMEEREQKDYRRGSKHRRSRRSRESLPDIVRSPANSPSGMEFGDDRPASGATRGSPTPPPSHLRHRYRSGGRYSGGASRQNVTFNASSTTLAHSEPDSPMFKEGEIRTSGWGETKPSSAIPRPGLTGGGKNASRGTESGRRDDKRKKQR